MSLADELRMIEKKAEGEIAERRKHLLERAQSAMRKKLKFAAERGDKVVMCDSLCGEGVLPASGDRPWLDSAMLTWLRNEGLRVEDNTEETHCYRISW